MRGRIPDTINLLRFSFKVPINRLYFSSNSSEFVFLTSFVPKAGGGGGGGGGGGTDLLVLTRLFGT